MGLGNPYVVDRPLVREDAGVARYKLLAEIAHGVRRGRQLVFVFGPDRMGKTTFLRQLADELHTEIEPVYVSFAWPDSDELRSRTPSEVAVEALDRLKAASAQQLHQAREGLEHLQLSDAGAIPGDAQVAALERAAALVLVDGLVLDHLRGEVGQAFLALWQQWLQRGPRLRFVATVNGTLIGAEMFAPALASLPGQELPPLTEAETENLLLQAAGSRLLYEFSAVKRIWQLSSGHPYLVQLFGYLLFGTHVGAIRVRAADVDRVIPEAIQWLDPLAERIWSEMPELARGVLVLTNELKGRHGVFHLRDLVTEADRQGLELMEPVIVAALREWQARGLLRSLGHHSYGFRAELFRRWLSDCRPTAQTLVQLKMRKRLHMVPHSRGSPRYYRWSTLALEAAGLLVVAAIITLWNLRGSPQSLTMGSLPTATQPPSATRATVAIGPALGRVVYMARDNADATWDIWVMRADGTDPEMLTSDPGDDMYPSWSPDGKSIAFVSDRDGNREIYVMQANGTQPINLTHHEAEDWTPAWSPDGTAIAFASYRDGNWELYVMGADGSLPLRLTSNSAADYGPCWSPDASEIAFHSNRDGNWEIYVIGRDGQGLRRLTDDPATDFAPAWSPDGSRIAFESYRDGNMEIYVMAADGSGQSNLTAETYSNEHGPSWARGGTRLLYFSNRDGGWDIFSMNPEGREKANLTLSPELEHAPRWHE